MHPRKVPTNKYAQKSIADMARDLAVTIARSPDAYIPLSEFPTLEFEAPVSAKRSCAAAYAVSAPLRVAVSSVWVGLFPDRRERFELRIGGFVALSLDACDLSRAQLRAAVLALGLEDEDQTLLLRAVASL